MKKLLVLFYILSLFFSCKIFAQDPPQMKKGFKMTSDFVNPYEILDRNWKSNTTSIITNHDYDALHYKLELGWHESYTSPFIHNYKAIETFTFKVDSTLNSIQLNAIDSSITVDSVKLAGITFAQTNDTLTVNLDATYSPGDTVHVMIYYTHNNVKDKAFLAKDGFVFTDCSPEKARNWFPCWDKPFDKATIEVIVKTKKGVKLCSNGALLDSITAGDTLIYHWKSKDPISTYIMANLSNLNFNYKEDYWKKPSNPQDSIPLIYYYNNGENVDSLREYASSMMDYFSILYGEYPYEKLAWATLNNDFPWSGMENNTLISLYTNGWTDVNTAVHEFAHHWFGNLITHETWADIFLKEGFPQISVALWQEHLKGKTGYLKQMIEFSSDYISYKPNPDRPIYNASWANTTPPSSIIFDYGVTYCKTPCIIHMLRGIVGDTTFFKILKSYSTDPNFMYKTAKVSDFYNKVNTLSGTDLSWFLDQWLNNAGYPTYNNSYTVTNNNSNWTLNYTAKQIQANTIFFKMPIEIGVLFTDNTDTIVSFMNDQNNQLQSFTFNKEPKTISFDPNVKILPKVETSTSGCSGVKNFTASADTIEDGSNANNYGNNANCFWHIMPSNSPTSINLHFLDFDTEDSTDILSVWDIIPTPAIKLAEYSGRNTPTDLVCNTSKIRLKFNSSKFVTHQGWRVCYTTTTGVNNLGNINLFSMYPNPANESLNINLQLENSDKLDIKISNMLGQNLYYESLVNIKSLDKVLNISNLQKGIYIIDITTSKGSIQKKFIKE
ncbi:MAG: M1 family aminopeptidase [Bacteroidota bacterium]